MRCGRDTHTVEDWTECAQTHTHRQTDKSENIISASFTPFTFDGYNKLRRSQYGELTSQMAVCCYLLVQCRYRD